MDSSSFLQWTSYIYIIERDIERYLKRKLENLFSSTSNCIYIYIHPRKINNLKRRKKDTHTHRHMYIKIEQEKKMEAVTHEIPEYSPIFLYSTADR